MIELFFGLLIFLLIAAFSKKQDSDNLAQEVFTDKEQKNTSGGWSLTTFLALCALAVLALIVLGSLGF